MASPEEPGRTFVLHCGASVLTSLQPERRRRLPGRIHHHNNKHFQNLGKPPSNQPPIVSLCAWRQGKPFRAPGIQAGSWNGMRKTAEELGESPGHFQGWCDPSIGSGFHQAQPWSLQDP